MSGRNALTSAEGTAWRYQLDCMINVLDHIDDRAAEIGDKATLRLIRCLYEAREAASEIEMRPQPAPADSKGVRLVKRLAEQ